MNDCDIVLECTEYVYTRCSAMLEHNSHNLVASLGMRWMNMVEGIKNNDWLPIEEKKLESQEQKRREKREEEEEIKRNARQKN